MSVKHIQDIPTEQVPDATGVTKAVLISAEEARNFAMRKFTMQPGGSMPVHTNKVEHEQYVLRGKATVRLGEEIFEVSAGDIVFIPADLPHYYVNITDEPFEFLCLVPNKEDVTTLL
jgi:quercetin dioxygenase-like cupin family protein